MGDRSVCSERLTVLLDPRCAPTINERTIANALIERC